MARDGMANLIIQLRRLTNAGTADATVASETFWSDDHLQEALDRYRSDWQQIPLVPVDIYRDSDTQTFDYDIPAPLKNFEEAGGTLSGWYLSDTTGGTVTASSINYESGKIHFDSDTDSAAYYLDCRTYNLNLAAADVWESKASFVFNNVDWSSDNHNIKASQEYDHCMTQARKFRSKGGAKVGRMVRLDENPSWR